MTQEEILQYNKRCALFLGWTYVEDGDSWIPPKTTFSQFYTFSSNLMYDSDWNWIMEVVEAIERDKYLLDKERPYYLTINNNYCGIFFNRWNDDGKDFRGTKQIVSIKDNSKKEAVVQAINQFLIWYNETSVQL